MTPAVRRIALAELGGAEIDRWRDLARSAAEPNPFFEPELVLPARDHLDGGGSVDLLLALEADEWHGCIPLTDGRGWRRTPVRSASSWIHLYCFAGTPLVRSGSEERVLGAWVEEAPWAGFLGLDLLATESSVGKALGRACANAGRHGVTYETTDRAGVLRDGEGVFPLTLKPKRRRELERQRRRLEERLGGPLTTTVEDGPTAVAGFLALESAGWKGRDGTALASDPAHRAFFEEMCRGFGDAGRLRLFRFGTPEHPVALLCCLVSGNTLFEFKIAFDEDLAEFSPGIQLERDVLAMVGADQPEVIRIDSCAIPTNQMANRFFADRIPIGAVAIPAKGFRGQLARFAVDKTAKARKAARRHE